LREIATRNVRGEAERGGLVPEFYDFGRNLGP
jgi:hypothetical protein